MKYLKASCLSLALAVLPVSGFAKSLGQGTTEFDGGLSFDTNSYKTSPESSDDSIDSESTSLSARVLYYIVPNFAVGALWMYTTNKTFYPWGESTEYTSYLIGPAFTFNMNISEKNSIKLGLELFTSNEESGGSDFETASQNGFGGSISGQFSHFVNDAVSLNGTLRIVKRVEDYGFDIGDVTTSGINLGAGVSVYF